MIDKQRVLRASVREAIKWVRVRSILLSTLSIGIVSVGSVNAQQLLGDPAIRDLLVGKSALFADYSVATYGGDGSYNYVAAINLNFRGRYTISGGKLCLMIKQDANRCDSVGQDGSGTYLLSSDGLPLRFAATTAIVAQTTQTLCGESIAYDVQPAAADIPENIRAFSGTWAGKWDYGLCGALIVESVKADGVASLIYVNGSFGGLNPIKAGSTRFMGTITGDTLIDGGLIFKAIRRGPGSLYVTRSDTRAVTTATFTRTQAKSARRDMQP